MKSTIEDPASVPTSLQASVGPTVGRAALRLRRTAILPILGLVVILGAWQGFVEAADIPAYLVPKPSDVLDAILEKGDLLWQSVLRTATASVSGLILAVFLGVAGAVILGFSQLLERSLFPYAIVMQTTPIVAIAPLIVIWFGAGLRSIVIIVFIISFFPVLSNTLMGLNSVDAEQRSLFRLHRASPWRTMWKLRLPSALPYIMAGMKISSGLAVIGAIVGEFIAGIGGGRGGLGYVITVSATQLDTSYLVAAALAGSALGILFFAVVNRLSRRLLAWHESVAKSEEKGGLAA